MLTLAQILDVAEPVTETGCFIWMRRTNSQGYAVARGARGKSYSIHRLVFALSQGISPADLSPHFCVRHSCDTPSCVNPDHLSAGSWADNVADCIRRGRHAVAFTERNGAVIGTCKNGHDLAVCGVYDYGTQPSGYRLRVCLECKRARGRKYWERKRNTTVTHHKNRAR